MKTLSILAMAISCAFSSLSAQEIKVTPDSQWKSVPDLGKSCYCVDYKGEGNPSIAIEKTLEPNSVYLVSWKMKGPAVAAGSKATLYIDIGEKAGYNYLIGAQWNPCYAYFNSGEAKIASFKLSLTGGPQGKVMAKDFAIRNLQDKDYEKNLLPDGNFEESKDILSCWSPETQQLAVGVSLNLLVSQDFLYGERMLSIVSDGPRASVRSIQLPVVPGRRYELRLWAKASHKTGLNATVQAWSPFGHKGKHFYRGKEFSLDKDWKELAFQFEIPSKINDYPDLRNGLMFIVIGCEKSDCPYSIMIDDVSFRQESQMNAGRGD